jgi:polysaccharide biosynthesis/export protein
MKWKNEMRKARASILGFGFVCASVFSALPIVAHANELSAYRIAPGETVEINIATLRDQNMRAVVQTDGTISLNGIGAMLIGGLTPTEFQQQLEMVLPTKLFRERAQDGQLRSYVIAPGDIRSSIINFRPVYVTGDVLSPGEQTYRPSMTATQMIAVAGGYSQIRGKIMKDAVDPVDLQRDYQSLWADFLKGHYHRVRIEAELKGQNTFEMRPPSGLPLASGLASAIAEGELETLKIIIEESAKEKAFLEAALKAAEQQADTLAAREKVEAAGEKADEQELAKVTQLFKNGNLTNDRVAEIRRSLLLTSSRRLGTLVELMKVRIQRADYQRQIEKSENQNRVELLKDLRDTHVLIANSEVKLRAVGAKLQLQNVVTSAQPSVEDRVRPRIIIVRKEADQWQQLEAGSTTEILPGDVLEVSLCSDSELGSSACPASQIDPQVTGTTPKTESN